MNFAQLQAWVNDPARTRGELQAACAGLGLNQAGNANVLRTRLRAYIAAQPDAMAPSPFTPAGWAPPASTLPPPARPRIGTGMIVGIAILLAILGVVWLVAAWVTNPENYGVDYGAQVRATIAVYNAQQTATLFARQTRAAVVKTQEAQKVSEVLGTPAPTGTPAATPAPTSALAAPAPTGTPVPTATRVPPTATRVPPTAAPVVKNCASEATREGRLDCATKEYFANGEKLDGIKAYMKAMGATWDSLKVGDPFQPDAITLPSGSPRIWGALVRATNLRVSGNSCLVTDVPSRIGSYKWVYLDTTYNPRPTVGHYGEAVTSGSDVEIAFNADCSDWPEIRDAAKAAGYNLK